MKTGPSFASLSQQHQNLDRLFDSHQRGLFASDTRSGTCGAIEVCRTNELFATTDLPGATIALLNDEAMFKSLFHHHGSREEKILFPRLDQRSTEEERETWLSDPN